MGKFHRQLLNQILPRVELPLRGRELAEVQASDDPDEKYLCAKECVLFNRSENYNSGMDRRNKTNGIRAVRDFEINQLSHGLIHDAAVGNRILAC